MAVNQRNQVPTPGQKRSNHEKRKTSSLSLCRLSRGLLAPVTTSKSLGWNTLLLDKEINQRLHRLHFLVGDELVVLCNGHEMNEAHVENIVLVDVPEWVEPVGMIQMRVATEHLLHDTLTILIEGLREPA